MADVVAAQGRVVSDEANRVTEKLVDNESGAVADVVLSDLLVEEVSIDGMCGVY